MSPVEPAPPEWGVVARACRERLSRLHAPTEASLLEMGDCLRHAHGISRNLTAMARALAFRLEDPEFQETVRGLDGTAVLVERLHRAKSDRGERLHGMSGTARAIGKALADLTQTMSHVRMIGVNARIEAAQLAAGTDDFGLFTHRIHGLARRGGADIVAVAGDLAGLQAAIDEALAEQLIFDQLHLRQLVDVSSRLSGSLDAMRRRQSDAAAAMERLPLVLAQMGSRIGAIVAALQFGDISRQRLEHVETALTTLAEVVEGQRPVPNGGEQVLPAFVAVVCGLQAGQLGQIEQEFSANVQAVLDNLREITVGIDGIRSESEAVYSDGIGGGSTFLMAVDKELEMVLAAVVHFALATARTEANLQTVADAAGRMGSAMKAIGEVDAEMNLIGLNASIKCGNLGDRGRALNVIAQELRACARHTASHAGAVADRLRRIGATAADASGSHEDSRSAETDSMEESLRRAIAQLRQSGGETAWVLSQIQVQSGEIVRSVNRLIDHFDAHLVYRAEIGDVMALLASLAAEAEGALPAADLAQARTEMLRFMEEHYTMQSERVLHDAATGQSTPPAAAAGEPDLSDILF